MPIFRPVVVNRCHLGPLIGHRSLFLHHRRHGDNAAHRHSHRRIQRSPLAPELIRHHAAKLSHCGAPRHVIGGRKQEALQRGRGRSRSRMMPGLWAAFRKSSPLRKPRRSTSVAMSKMLLPSGTVSFVVDRHRRARSGRKCARPSLAARNDTLRPAVSPTAAKSEPPETARRTRTAPACASSPAMDLATRALVDVHNRGSAKPWNGVNSIHATAPAPSSASTTRAAAIDKTRRLGGDETSYPARIEIILKQKHR